PPRLSSPASCAADLKAAQYLSRIKFGVVTYRKYLYFFHETIFVEKIPISESKNLKSGFFFEFFPSPALFF
ncbi:hypothetical protein LJB99_06735, partial [Deltaproteobacteria bacterium OttesenSCG-928-K17]|nr:hypothetical protein [Deltaproteobacteria bacterium OttesenSCG-928-K17]